MTMHDGLEPGVSSSAAYGASGQARYSRLAAAELDRQAPRPATACDLQQIVQPGPLRGRPRATSLNSITLSDGKSQGERAPSRRYLKSRGTDRALCKPGGRGDLRSPTQRR